MGKTPDKPARRQGAGITRWLMRVAMLAAAIPMAAAGLLFIFSKQELIFNPAPLAYDLKSGSTLRSVARDLEALGIMTTPGSALLFEVMGRLRGDAPHIKAGKLKVLGFNSAKRLRLYPDVPTMDEIGLGGFDVRSWMGLSMPAAVPDQKFRVTAKPANCSK